MIISMAKFDHKEAEFVIYPLTNSIISRANKKFIETLSFWQAYPDKMYIIVKASFAM